MSDRPYPGESLSDFRARRSRELDDQAKGVGSGPSADDQVEAAKAKVRQGNAEKARARVSDPKNMVNHMDSAADTDDQVKAVHKNLAGGVKPVDKAAADAAYKADTSFHGKSADEQAAVAKGAKPAHTTSTPGSTSTPAVGAAMAAAGVKKPEIKVSPEVGARARRNPAPAPSREVSEHNNMGAPRGGDKGGVLGGVASHDSKSDLDAARAAATRGSRNVSGRKAEENAARKSTARSAASAAPVTRAPAQDEGLYGNRRRAEGFAHILGLSGPSSKVSDKPAQGSPQQNVQKINRADIPAAPAKGPRYAQGLGTPVPAANPAPSAPVATAPNSGSTAADRFTPRGNLDRASVGAGRPVLGKDITYGINAEKGPVANTRRAYQAHIAGGGSNDSYWADRDAKKSAKPAGKTPPTATVEPIAAAPKATPAARPYTPQPAPPMPAAPKPLAGTPGPSRIPVPQATPMAAPQVAKASPAPATPPAAPATSSRRPASPSSPTPAPSGSNDRLSMAPDERWERHNTATPVATPSAPTGVGRPNVAPPRMGSTGGLHQGGEHNVNVGGDNYGQITHNHNTYNINHGVNNGSMGNVDHGYAPRGGGSGGGGGRTPGGHTPHGGHEPHFDLWVNDVNGHHSLSKGVQHVTGQTDGHGRPTAKAKATRAAGGTQQPLNGSPRAAGGTPAPASNGTGTTHNWTGPAHTAPTSASGNGTANQQSFALTPQHLQSLGLSGNGTANPTP